ncbi:hypothetical protein GCM10023238_11190 [Streptomyces heliomycini]
MAELVLVHPDDAVDEVGVVADRPIRVPAAGVRALAERGQIREAVLQLRDVMIVLAPGRRQSSVRHPAELVRGPVRGRALLAQLLLGHGAARPPCGGHRPLSLQFDHQPGQGYIDPLSDCHISAQLL